MTFPLKIILAKMIENLLECIRFLTIEDLWARGWWEEKSTLQKITGFLMWVKETYKETWQKFSGIHWKHEDTVCFWNMLCLYVFLSIIQSFCHVSLQVSFNTHQKTCYFLQCQLPTCWYELIYGTLTSESICSPGAPPTSNSLIFHHKFMLCLIYTNVLTSLDIVLTKDFE